MVDATSRCRSDMGVTRQENLSTGDRRMRNTIIGEDYVEKLLNNKFWGQFFFQNLQKAVVFFFKISLSYTHCYLCPIIRASSLFNQCTQSRFSYESDYR